MCLLLALKTMQIGPPNPRPKGGIKGFFEAIKALWHNTWDSVIDFFTGRSCRYTFSSLAS
jgi:hypothetical protein